MLTVDRAPAAQSTLMPSDTSKLHITERQAGDVTILDLSGEILVDDGDLLFRERVHGLVAVGRVKLIADLGAVTYIDSSGLGMIVAKLKTVREKGGDIRLLHLTSRGQRLLSLMRLISIFQTFDDEDAAVRSYA